jgi:hypothetical protein
MKYFCIVTLLVANLNFSPFVKGQMILGPAQIDRNREISEGSYQEARKALTEAISDRDGSAVRIALRQRRFGPGFQIDAVEAVRILGGKHFVPDLIVALEKNRGIAWRGGDETIDDQRKLNRAIIKTLSALTKIKFRTGKAPTSKEIETVIAASQKWWTQNKQK